MAKVSDAASVYVEQCHRYKVDVNAGIAASLLMGSRAIVPDRHLQALDLLPLLQALPLATQVQELHLAHARLGVAVAGLLVDCLRRLPSVVRLDLEGSRIGPQAAAPLLEYMATGDCPLEHVNLRRCHLGGSLTSMILDVLRNPASRLKSLDLSSNQLGMASVFAIQSVGCAFEVDTESNLYVHEILNSVTHGVGLLFAMIGSWFLIRRAWQTRDTRNLVGTVPYAFALCLTYLSSTLYHSLFKLRAAKRFFKYLDHGSVFMLIAGSYTPFLVISLRSRPEIANPMLLGIWLLALVGIFLTTFMRGHKHFDWLSTALYLAMGWMCVIAGVPIVRSGLIPQPAMLLVLHGGIAYTVGVAFLVKGATTPAMHIVWHLWVLLGSSLHYAAIVAYIVPLSS
ncbi:Hemolysin III [Plasmodiophora brassicae]|nr:hypothetical protein PBRA_007777 [Plasmodiophora brassicae]